MISTKSIVMLGLFVWSGVGGGLVVNHIHSTRGVTVVERIKYEPNPFEAEVAKYTPLMEQLLSNRDRRGMASAPQIIRRSTDDGQVRSHPPLPRARPDRSRTSNQALVSGSGSGLTLEGVISLAEAGL